MEQQVENVERTHQVPRQQQADFFDEMRFGPKRSQAERDSGEDKGKVRNSMQEFCEHGARTTGREV